MKKKWLFFDVGYTLVNEDDVWKTRCVEQVKLPQNQGYKQLTPDEFNNALKEGFMKNIKFKNIVKDLGYSEIVRFPYEKEFLYEDIISSLEELAEKYNLGIIANQDKGLNGRLDKLGILKYFSVILGSDDCGYAKPNLEIFKSALKEAGCDAEDACMIGDRLDNDIKPAKELGFKTIRILKGYRIKQKPNGEFDTPNFEIDSIKEILNLKLW